MGTGSVTRYGVFGIKGVAICVENVDVTPLGCRM